MKFISFLAASFFLMTFKAHSSENFKCVYLSQDKIDKTTINFSLPDSYKFGTLVPIKINVNGKKKSEVSMNTVVIKDRPYIVLSDLYRIKSPRSSLVIIMFKPSANDLFLSYINMGFTPSASFFIANCSNNEGENI